MATQETVKQINSGGVLRDVEDVGARQLIASLRAALDAITSGDTTTAIKTFNEIIAFLDNIEDTSTLQGIIAGLNTAIAAKYTKPNTGIPASDLAQSVIDVLNAVAGKVNAVEGKGLSTEDFTTALKEKLEGLSNYDDTALQTAVSTLQTALADVYTKDETEEKIAEAVEGLGGGSVESVTVNGTKHTPDANGDVDLGSLKGEKGDQGDTLLVDGEFNPVTDIVNDTTTGGASDALSAEMGKRVAGREATDRQRIDAIVAILKKSVFTDDQTAAFAALDALANGIDSISFNASSHKFTNLGDTFSLSVVTDPAGKTAQVTWSTSNASVATVNNGVVTAVADGNAVITATTTDGKVAVCSIVVETIVITGITLNKSTLTLNGNDDSETLVATTIPAGYESGVQWSSSDPTKATVDNNGKVTAVANGSAVITASIGGHSATCQVTVTGVMQTFHISIGTLTNVTIEDGQGNAITNGQAVMEGSSLAITFAPSASHVIDALSVVMGSTTLSLADAADGAGGAKVITIASVSGDIAISASATYQAKDYADDAIALTNYGVQPSGGSFTANNNTDCLIIPLDFGKVYHLTGWNWKSQGGTTAGFNFSLVKSDGNGGYANVINGTDVTIPSGGQLGEIQVTSANRIVMESNVQLARCKDNFVFSVPPASAFSGVDKVYLAINTRWETALANTMPISVKEINVGSYADMFYAGLIPHLKFLANNGGDFNSRLYAVDFGESYSYSGYDWTGGTNNGYIFGVVGIVGGVFHLFTPSEITGLDQFFTSTSYAERIDAPASGSFTTPAQSAFSVAADKLFILANTKCQGDSITMPDFTLTENS